MTFQEAVKIIERDLKTIKNPRILEIILDILGYTIKIQEDL